MILLPYANIGQRARKMDLAEYHSLPNSARHYKMLRYGPEARTSDLRSHSLRFFSSNSSSEEAGLNEDSKESSEVDLRQDDDIHNMIKVVRLDGYICEQIEKQNHSKTGLT